MRKNSVTVEYHRLKGWFSFYGGRKKTRILSILYESVFLINT